MRFHPEGGDGKAPRLVTAGDLTGSYPVFNTASSLTQEMPSSSQDVNRGAHIKASKRKPERLFPPENQR